MSKFLNRHELVHGNYEIAHIESQWDLEPCFEVSAIVLCVVDWDWKEHDEDTNAWPHNFEKLDSFSLHCFMPSLHSQVLKSSPLLIHFTLLSSLWHETLLTHTQHTTLHSRLVNHWLLILLLLRLWTWVNGIILTWITVFVVVSQHIIANSFFLFEIIN